MLLGLSSFTRSKYVGTLRRRTKKIGRHRMVVGFIAVYLIATYLYVMNSSFSSTLLGKAHGKSKLKDSPISDSTVRIQRIPPQQWTKEDVSAWLTEKGFSHLRNLFRVHAVSGQKLLKLDEHDLVREIHVQDEHDVSRILHEIDVLRLVMKKTSNWKSVNRAPSLPGTRMIRIYSVGDNMIYDSTLKKEISTGVPPATEVPLKAGVDKVADLIARATKELKRPVRELVASNGDPISDLIEIPDKVFALCDKDFYVFPVEHPGFKQSILLPSEDREVQVETLSTSPRVFLVADFLKPDECEYLIEFSKAKMGRSTIAEAGNEAKNGVGSARTSSTAWLSKTADPLVAKIRTRVAELVKLPMELAEDMQVLHYSKNQHYWAHHDFFDPNIYRGFVTSPGQNRFITVFFYLSDVEEGGETVFPFANGDDRRVTDFADCSRGLKVKPKAGNAIIFYSMLAKRQQEICPPDDLGCNLDVRSLHGGCDVIKGDKWAANYWIANKK
mmetsp:Transcript_25392/g.83994  ORF Transcript_25392/g.83994 Transcript_25392/m.83994 type:complete len:499 (+) Transcript_25392:200-1696(+)